mgnify:FL=1
MKKLALVLVSLFIVSSAQALVNITWLSFDATDETGAALGLNSIVQLVNAGADGTPNMPDHNAANYLSGDDTLLDSLVIGEEGGLAAGQFNKPATEYDIPTTTSLYIRAYNLTSLDSPPDMFYYGETPTGSNWGDASGQPPPAPDSWFVTGLATGTEYIIPEPSTIMLALAGFLVMLRKLRK